jgi:hypothetical protein
MPGRSKRIVVGALAILVGIPALLAGYFAYTRFYRYQGKVDQFVRAIPSEDRTISEEAEQVFEKLDGESITWIATKCLLYEVARPQFRLANGIFGDSSGSIFFQPASRIQK